MSESTQSNCAERLKVLADPTRLNVLRVLMTGPLHVGEINTHIDIDQSLLSHHLRVLREAELVRAERDGKAVLYSMNPTVFSDDQLKKALNLGCCEIIFD
jgi:ArsR family transcriptional regulator